jgi:hypothetical protein
LNFDVKNQKKNGFRIWNWILDFLDFWILDFPSKGGFEPLPGPKKKILGLKKFSKILEMHLVPGTTFKKNKKTLR